MSVKNMWAAYRQMKAQSRNMRGIIQAWRKYKEFMQMHKALQKQSRRLRRVRMDDIIREAEDGTDPRNENIHGLFTLIKRIAPETGQEANTTSSREWTTAGAGRGGNRVGKLLEECKRFRHVDTTPRSVDRTGPRLDHACTFPGTKFKAALRALQGSKAAPPHLAPHALWKAAAKPVADFVAEVVGTSWATQGTFYSSGVGGLMADLPQ